MRSWARIHEGMVVEVIRTVRPIKALFHPSMVWIEATQHVDVAPGWRWHAGAFARPDIRSHLED